MSFHKQKIPEHRYSWKWITAIIFICTLCATLTASNWALQSAADNVKRTASDYKQAYDEYLKAEASYKQAITQLNNAKSAYEHSVQEYKDELERYQRSLKGW